MREVISVHVGQAGVQIGNACCMFFFPPSFSRQLGSTVLSWVKLRRVDVAGNDLKMWYDADLIIRGTVHRRAWFERKNSCMTCQRTNLYSESIVARGSPP